MGVRIIQGDGTGDGDYAVLYCSTSGTAFGPLFRDHDEAQAFLDWMGESDDPRRYSSSELHEKFSEFREDAAQAEKESEATKEEDAKVE